MNEPESSSPTPAELANQIDALRRQTFTLLLVLIVVSGTLTVFLYRQASVARNDIKAIKPQAAALVQAYNQNLPLIQSFVKEIAAYGATHPDFQPILKKYQLQPPAPKK
jgi:phospholipase/lecithinase/hemolysin